MMSRVSLLVCSVGFGVGLVACSTTPDYVYVAPASVEEVSDGLWEVTLTEGGAERTGIELGAVEMSIIDGAEQLVIPYSAVMYHFDGSVWTYSGDGLTFVRLPIEIARIADGVAVLASGPPVGTPVVTVGAAELYGVEFGIGK